MKASALLSWPFPRIMYDHYPNLPPNEDYLRSGWQRFVHSQQYMFGIGIRVHAGGPKWTSN